MDFGRRIFLLLLAAGASAAGVFRSGTNLHAGAEGTERDSGSGMSGNPFVRARKSLVAAVGGKDLAEMVRRAVSLIGGFGPLALRGKSVLVKPNVVGGNGHPTTTNPAVVAAVVSVLYEEGARKVYVGDMSALIRGSTAKNMERSGILAAARGAGAEPLFCMPSMFDSLGVRVPYPT